MLHFDDGSGPALYMSWGDATLARMVRWRDDQWEFIEDGLPAPDPFRRIRQPFVLDEGSGPALYAIVDVPLQSRWVGRWDGAEWQEALQGLVSNTFVPALSVDVGDGMRTYGVRRESAQAPPGIVRLDGGVWTEIGTGLARLSVFDFGSGPGLYAIGQIEINGTQARGVLRWTGTQWLDLSSSGWVVDYGRDTVVFDDGTGPTLFTITHIWRTGEPHAALRKWLGPGPQGGWEIVGQAVVPGGTIAYYTGLHVFDDGRGPAIYMVGEFTNINGVPARRIARYDGQNWEGLGDGLRPVDGYPSSMATIQTSRGPTLLMSGPFDMAGGGHSPRLVAWVGCPNCYANCDGSTTPPVLNVDDFTCFINKFAAQDPYANCDNSTVEPMLNVEDFMCFISRFSAGCP